MPAVWCVLWMGSAVYAGPLLDGLQKELDELAAKVSPCVVLVKGPAGQLNFVIGRDTPGQLMRLELPQPGWAGVVVSDDGYIITSAGPFQRGPDTKAGLKVTVTGNDGKEHAAELVAADGRTGLAVLKLTEGKLPALPLAEGPPRAGQLVLVVSVEREGVQSRVLAITGEPGAGPNAPFPVSVSFWGERSGALLADTSGKLLGFLRAPGPMLMTEPMPNGPEAQPSGVIRKVLQDVKRQGTVTWGFLGLVLKARAGHGLDVTEVVAGSPAEKAGVKVGDVVTGYQPGPAVEAMKFTGEQRDVQLLADAVRFTSPGAKAKLTVKRGEETQDIEVTIGVAPEEPRPDYPFGAMPGMPMGQAGQTWLGVQLARVPGGVEVVGALPDSPAAKAGLKAGDVILELDGQPVTDPDGVRQLVLAHKPGQKVDLKVKRDDKEMMITVELGASPGPQVPAFGAPGAPPVIILPAPMQMQLFDERRQPAWSFPDANFEQPPPPPVQPAPQELFDRIGAWEAGPL